MGGASHNIELRGFSINMGVHRVQHKLAMAAVRLIKRFPELATWSARSSKPGKPYICSDDRREHHPEPGGPCLALLHEEQGVPAHTHSTAPEVIQPLRVWKTLGLRRISLWGPLRISTDTTTHPNARRRLDNRSDPENNSRMTAALEFRAARRAARNCFRSSETTGSGLARHFTLACGLASGGGPKSLVPASALAGERGAPLALEKGCLPRRCRSARLQNCS